MRFPPVSATKLVLVAVVAPFSTICPPIMVFKVTAVRFAEAGTEKTVVLPVAVIVLPTLMVNGPVMSDAPALTVKSPPLTVTPSAELTLNTVAELFTKIVCEPGKSGITASSLATGTRPRSQLAALFQLKSAGVCLNVTVASNCRCSSSISPQLGVRFNTRRRRAGEAFVWLIS